MSMDARGRFILMTWLLAVCAGAAVTPAAEPTTKIDYDRQIRPILSDKCYHCHGPDAETREADMRLDRRDGVPEHVLMPGEPDESELVRRIMSEDEAERMPPVDSHLVLTDDEKQLIAEWIAEGAEFTEHWSFRPLPQEVPTPRVRDADWPRNGIDRFVLARLESEGSKPSPPADPLRLLRRVTLDLTGLPPTPEEIRDFERAATDDPDAALRGGRRSVAGEPRVRRAHGSGVARRGALRRLLRLSNRPTQHAVAVPRLGRAGVQREPAVRSVPHLAIRGRPAAEHPTPRPDSGDRVQPAASSDERRRVDRRGMAGRECGRSRPDLWARPCWGSRSSAPAATITSTTRSRMRDYYSLSAFFNSIDENGMYDQTAKVPSPSLLLPTAEQEAALEDAKQAIAAAEAELQQRLTTASRDFTSGWQVRQSESRPPTRRSMLHRVVRRRS